MGVFSICIYYTDDRHILNQWDYLLSHYIPDKIYLMDAPSKEELRHNNIIKHAIHIKDIDSLPKDIPLILLAPKNGRYIQGNESIVGFKHPKNAIYMFGPDNKNLDMSTFKSRMPDEYIYIPTDTHYEMYAVTATTAARTLVIDYFGVLSER